jgi:glycosyltransferase involved in cell wall biosynthesis
LAHYVLDARTATPHFPGIGRYVANLACTLAPLLASDERLTILHHPQHPFVLPDVPAVRLLPVATSPFALAQQWQLPRLLCRLRADLYHSAYVMMPYAPGVPTVLTIYDLIPVLLPEQSSRRARWLARWANRLALRTARCALAISEATRADYIRHLCVEPGKVIAVPLAADPAFKPAADRGRLTAVREKYGLPERYVLYFGSNKPHKNLVRLVEAWDAASGQVGKWASRQVGKSASEQVSKSANRQIANGESAEDVSRFTFHVPRLVIAGAWDARYPEPRQRAEALGLADRVGFLGPVPEADLPDLYAGAELFVFPSLYEGFGLPVLEAMACGVPVVCSQASSLPEVAGDAAVQVDPLDVAALADAIRRVLADADLRETMRVTGLAQAARFSWERTARQTLAAYRAVCRST